MAAIELEPLVPLFFATAETLGDHPFLKVADPKGRTRVTSWSGMAEMVLDAMAALDALGIRKGDRTGLTSENRTEWFCTDLATLGVGAVNVVLMPSYSDRMIVRTLGHSSSRLVFVEDREVASRIEGLRTSLPGLEHIVLFDETSPSPGITTWDAFLERGRQHRAADPARIRRLADEVTLDDLATIMYTSGSTGDPKGVMRNHRNMVANQFHKDPHLVPGLKPTEVAGLALTLNHLLGRAHYYRSVMHGRTISTTRAAEHEITLKDVAELAPTIMSLSPRLMIRLWDELVLEPGRAALWRTYQEKGPEAPRAIEKLRASLQEAVGGQLRFVYYGGSPMPKEILEAFDALGAPILAAYGSTECGPIATMELDGRAEHRGWIGRTYEGTELRLGPDGEVLVRGPGVTPGYFLNDAVTREVIDADGWFHTGDLGTLTADGWLRLEGRKKDTFNCADGSNIYPATIERALEVDLIKEVVLIGDRKPYIVALVHPNAAALASAMGVREVDLGSADVRKLVWAQVERLNVAIEDYERVRRIEILTEPFPPTVRTRTEGIGKVKVARPVVYELYADVITRLYSESAADGPSA